MKGDAITCPHCRGLGKLERAGLKLFHIFGKPVSKNRSQIVHRSLGGKKVPMVIKSNEAKQYVEAVRKQLPQEPIEGPVKVSGTLYYPSRRSDIEPSVLLDALQGYAYVNDRQIECLGPFWRGIDKDNPRAEIIVEKV